MSDLANLIDKAFREGSTGITIWRSEKHGYQANVRNKDNVSWRIEVDRRPSRALLKALDGSPKRPPHDRDEDLI